MAPRGQPTGCGGRSGLPSVSRWLPDPIFEAADELASRLGKSRSRLYAEAVEVYVRSRRGEGVTEALDRVYADQPSELDPAIAALQSASLTSS